MDFPIVDEPFDFRNWCTCSARNEVNDLMKSFKGKKQGSNRSQLTIQIHFCQPLLAEPFVMNCNDSATIMSKLKTSFYSS